MKKESMEIKENVVNKKGPEIIKRKFNPVSPPPVQILKISRVK